MSNKKLILDALQCRETPRAPWLPYVGVHGAKLLDVTATEYLHDAALIARGQEAAAVRYQADGIPVVFDLQLEAEALGCALSWADDGPPSVASHPAASAATARSAGRGVGSADPAGFEDLPGVALHRHR